MYMEHSIYIWRIIYSFDTNGAPYQTTHLRHGLTHVARRNVPGSLPAFIHSAIKSWGVESGNEAKIGYTPCRHMHKEYGDNLRAGFIKLDPWSNACGRKGSDHRDGYTPCRHMHE